MPKAVCTFAARHSERGERYALDVTSPSHYLATCLERQNPAPCSINEIADSYRHFIAADLFRVWWWELRQPGERRRCSHLVQWERNRDARRMLLRMAAASLAQWLIIEEQEDDTLVAFRPGVGFDDLRLDGRALHRTTSGRDANA